MIWYDVLLLWVCCRFVKQLVAELKGFCNRYWNPGRTLVFSYIIILTNENSWSPNEIHFCILQ